MIDRRGAVWLHDEIEQLKQEWNAHMTLHDMALAHGRTPYAILGQLSVHGLLVHRRTEWHRRVRDLLQLERPLCKRFRDYLDDELDCDGCPLERINGSHCADVAAPTAAELQTTMLTRLQECLPAHWRRHEWYVPRPINMSGVPLRHLVE